MDPINLALVVFGAAAGVIAVIMALFVMRALGEAKALRERLDEARVEHEADRTELIRAGARLERLGVVEGERDAALAHLREARERLARQDQEIAERHRALETERKRLTEISEQMQEKFKLLAADALTNSQKQFLERAQETFRLQQEKAEGGVKELVRPIRERLEAFKTKVEDIEKERVAHHTAIGEHIKQLSQGLETQRAETAKLVNALQYSSTTRGRWGEETVENILGLAGLTKGIDYEAQHHTHDGDGGTLKPDFVVRLPNEGCFVVDAKVAFKGFIEAVNAPDDDDRKHAMQRHVAQVRTHVRQLAKKDYAAAVDGAIDFVALFIPGESLYAAAMEHDPDLFDDAIAAGVIITTPATLLALAKAVAYGFRQKALEQDAKQIGAMGAELYNRMASFTSHMRGVGRALGSATDKYNSAVGSLERSVLPQARKFADLDGVKSGKALDELEPVDETPRALAAPDWVDDTDSS